MRSEAAEPHLPVIRAVDGSWLYATPGQLLVVDGGWRVVCHACGAALTSIAVAHLRRHDLSLDAYRERFGLNKTASLLSPQLQAERREEGRRRWTSNVGVREGLSANHDLARSGALHQIGVAAQPAGSRRLQSRRTAARSTQAGRDSRMAEAQQRWTTRATALGFDDLGAYLSDRRAAKVSTLVLRAELGCGGSTAERLLRGG